MRLSHKRTTIISKEARAARMKRKTRKKNKNYFILLLYCIKMPGYIPNELNKLVSVFYLVRKETK